MLFAQLGSSYFSVKSIILKYRFKFSQNIKTLDLDYFNEYIIILFENKPNEICFFRLSDLIANKDKTEEQDKSLFELKFQNPVIDFFVNKNEDLEKSMYKNFLIIQTTRSLIIYRESVQRIMKKVFSLNISTTKPEETRFKFLVNNRYVSDKNDSSLTGCFYVLIGNVCHIHYVKNLEKRQQAILIGQYKMTLPFDKDSKLVSANSSNISTVEICTFTKNFVLTKYDLILEGLKGSVNLNSFKLLTKTIDSPNFVYNNKNKFIFGNLEHADRLFSLLKDRYEQKFFFKTVLDNYNSFKDCYWSLIREGLFVKINYVKKIIELFGVDLELNRIVIKQEKEIEIIKDLDSIELVRFLLVDENEFVVMFDTEKEFLITRFVLERERIQSIKKICTINKKDVSEEEIKQYELVLMDKETQLYQFIFFNTNNIIRTYTFTEDIDSLKLAYSFKFDCKILEFYKNDEFPFNPIVLTDSNYLYFLNNKLEYQCDYSLSNIDLNLESNSNNFHLKKLYDNYYIVS